MDNRQDRRVYRQGYDPEYWASRALSAAEVIEADVAAQWLKHPCTQILILSLQADMAGVVQEWLNGGYSNNDSVDGTAQLQAKARGMAQANDNTIETIGLIGKGQFGEQETY